MASSTSQIVICGAGPAGLIAALKFAQAGLEVTVIEAEAGINTSPRACVYFPATLEGLDSIGVLEDLREISFCGGEAGRYVPDYNWFRSFPVDNPDAGPYASGANVGQEEVGALIARHLLAFPKAQIRWNTRLIAMDERDDGVSLTVETDGGARETIGCDWLIGADGARSTVRALAGIEFEGHSWPDRFFATNVDFNFRDVGMVDGQFRCHPDSWAVIVRVNNKGVWRVAFGEDGALPEESIHERIPERLKDFIPQGEPYNLLQAGSYRVHQRAGTTLRKGRVLLAGDAAHATNPLGGLGLTTGIWDSMILGDLLPAVVRGEVTEDALDAYSRERLRIFWQLTSPMATENKRLIQERDPARRRADMKAFDDQFLAARQGAQGSQMAAFSYMFIGDPILETSRWRQYLGSAPARA